MGSYFDRIDPAVMDVSTFGGYDIEMVRIRMTYIDRPGLDLGCGPGAYLRAGMVGIDSNARMLAHARVRLPAAQLVAGDLRALPIQSASVALTVSFATLYYVPQVNRALAEMARVLRPGGLAVFELGNLWSLNTLVADKTVSAHVAYPNMGRFIRDAGLRVREHRAFQLSPMYGGPWWLRPLVDSRWRRVLGRKIRGRMLDEWISTALRPIAFRHLFVCEKP